MYNPANTRFLLSAPNASIIAWKNRKELIITKHPRVWFHSAFPDFPDSCDNLGSEANYGQRCIYNNNNTCATISMYTFKKPIWVREGYLSVRNII